jgi:hypothetical protein
VTLSVGRLLDHLRAAAGESSWEAIYRPTAFRSAPFWGRTGWYFGGGRMLIRAELTPSEAIKTVAHEAMHIYESQRYRLAQTPEERAGEERRAEEYAQRTWAKLTGATR